MLEHRDGAVSTLHLADGGNGTQPLERYTLFGENAHLEIENAGRVTLQRGIPFDYGVTTTYAPPGTDSGAVVWEAQNMLGTLENMALFTQGMYAELRHFCDSVLEGRPATRGTLEFALHVMHVYEAALLSEGGRVEVDETTDFTDLHRV